MGKDSLDKARRPARASLRVLADADSGETKAKILDAAFRRLAQEGYAALSVREIARDAGVNHALINYHFGSKDQLVIEVLDAANRRLLARQAAMYKAPGSFADKWAQARRFYEGDLASGFVRVQYELWAASLSNPALRERFAPRLLAWKKIVRDAVHDALDALERDGVTLPPPFTAEVIGCWIADFWLGMEVIDLLGVEGEAARHRKALDAVGQLLQSLDARAGPAEAVEPVEPVESVKALEPASKRRRRSR